MYIKYMYIYTCTHMQVACTELHVHVSLGGEQIILKFKPKITWVFITKGECRREIAILCA